MSMEKGTERMTMRDSDSVMTYIDSELENENEKN